MRPVLALVTAVALVGFAVLLAAGFALVVNL